MDRSNRPDDEWPSPSPDFTVGDIFLWRSLRDRTRYSTYETCETYARLPRNLRNDKPIREENNFHIWHVGKLIIPFLVIVLSLLNRKVPNLSNCCKHRPIYIYIQNNVFEPYSVYLLFVFAYFIIRTLWLARIGMLVFLESQWQDEEWNVTGCGLIRIFFSDSGESDSDIVTWKLNKQKKEVPYEKYIEYILYYILYIQYILYERQMLI